MLVLFFAISNSQTVDDVFDKMNRELTGKHCFQFNSTYKLYKDYKTKVAFETYNGVFKKNSSNDIYMKINNTEFLNTKKYSLKINHDEKAMIIESQKKFSQADFDVSKLLVFCEIESFKDYKNYWQIVLVSKKFSTLNYSKIVLKVNKNYTLKNQVFYFNNNVDFSKSYNKQDLSSPRLEIEYNGYSKNEVNQTLFNTNKFFIEKLNKISPAALYKAYELIDKRAKKSQIKER